MVYLVEHGAEEDALLVGLELGEGLEAARVAGGHHGHEAAEVSALLALQRHLAAPLPALVLGAALQHVHQPLVTVWCLA